MNGFPKKKYGIPQPSWHSLNKNIKFPPISWTRNQRQMPGEMRTSCTEALEGDEGSGGWGMASVLAVLIGKLAIFVGKMMLETTMNQKV